MGVIEQTAASFFTRAGVPHVAPLDAVLPSDLLIYELFKEDASDAQDRPDGFQQTGQASWYGDQHHGRTTASGEKFDMNKLTAAHRTLPMGTAVRVTNLDNGRSIEVVINDRGPYVGARVIDLSREAARRLNMEREGLAPVRIEELSRAPTRNAMN
ncbi:MAG TPA: septal ring lytic transglycosylase RlpA family protein [Alphaproteobacteria bacterium]|nr:septal ring lytic transglycosylase RlpA family protein [Alphaproteobacteria bacterium]